MQSEIFRTCKITPIDDKKQESRAVAFGNGYLHPALLTGLSAGIRAASKTGLATRLCGILWTMKIDTKKFPTGCGVYQMKGEDGAVLYVGKAKNLRNRLRTYFAAVGGDGRPQIRFLLNRVREVETIVTDTEKEALLLENTLIKKYRPRYNINLRDDKTYVSLRLDPREAFPPCRSPAGYGATAPSTSVPILPPAPCARR